MSNEVFLIDSNILIQPKKTYYPFDFAPGFWQQLKKHIEAGEIAILDKVMNEIQNGSDELWKWLSGINISSLITYKDTSIIYKYSEVINNVKSNRCYKQSALDEWSKNTVADAWLIATAAVKNYTLITMETSSGIISPKSPSKNAKIPDVANCFSVKTDNLFYMMRELNFVLR